MEHATILLLLVALTACTLAAATRGSRHKARVLSRSFDFNCAKRFENVR